MKRQGDDWWPVLLLVAVIVLTLGLAIVYSWMQYKGIINGSNYPTKIRAMVEAIW